VQLIGVEQCTAKPFGYCGNDFGAFADLDPQVHAQVRHLMSRIGDWLRSLGYVGAFGADFLVDDGRALLVEVNARMQGSTRAACLLSSGSHAPCLLVEHMAACIGLPMPVGTTDQLVSSLGEFGHLILHNQGADRRLDGIETTQGLRALEFFVTSDVGRRREACGRDR
jgi:hypothetical protein